MKPARFEYDRAPRLEDAVALLAAADSDARVLAGGQTLGPMLNMRLAMPSRLIDLGAIAMLKQIHHGAETLKIGACVTHAMLEDSTEPSPLARLLSHVASTIAFRAIRNRGTVGGSLAHADPAADWPTVMTLLDARLAIIGPDGRRSIAMVDFMQGAFTTALRHAEVIESIEIAQLSADARWGYFKVCRKTGEFPEATGGAVFDHARGLQRVVAGALDGTPALLPALARQVARDGTAAAGLANVSAAVAAIAPGMDPVDLQLHAAAVRRALLQAIPS